MIKDERNYHLRLQEFCDCYMETDYKKELEAASRGVSGIPGGDPDELALKFLGAAILYGATEEAKNFSIKKAREGKILFSIEGKGKYQLPPPQTQIADRIFSIVRSITHIEKDHGKMPLSLGLRNDRIELTLYLDRVGAEESLTVAFPQG